MKDVKTQIKEIDNEIAELEEQKRKLTETQNTAISVLMNKRNELLKKAFPANLCQGDWDCPNSPTGLCGYDPRKDPAFDSCVFCGEPDERK